MSEGDRIRPIDYIALVVVLVVVGFIAYKGFTTDPNDNSIIIDSDVGEYDVAGGAATLEYVRSDSIRYKAVVIPRSVTVDSTEYDVVSIGPNAFKGSGITSVVIASSVKDIGMGAFSSCGYLTHVTLGSDDDRSSIVSIGSNAFSECDKLKEIEIYANSSDVTIDPAAIPSGVNIVWK